MKKMAMVCLMFMCGFLCSGCGSSSGDSLLATKVNSFKVSINGVDQAAPVTIPADTDVKFDWNVDVPVSTTYDANLYISSTTDPGDTPIVVKVSKIASDNVTCSTSKNGGKTFITCTGLTNAYDVSGFVGSTAYVVLKVYGVTTAKATSSIAIIIQ
jgi:hypothetical protein